MICLCRSSVSFRHPAGFGRLCGAQPHPRGYVCLSSARRARDSAVRRGLDACAARSPTLTRELLGLSFSALRARDSAVRRTWDACAARSPTLTRELLGLSFSALRARDSAVRRTWDACAGAQPHPHSRVTRFIFFCPAGTRLRRPAEFGTPVRRAARRGRLWGYAPFSAPLASPPKHPLRKAFSFRKTARATRL